MATEEKTEEVVEVSIASRPLNAREKKLLAELTTAGATVEVVIPETITVDDWIEATSVTCRGIYRARTQEQMLLPVLGRLLLIAKANPETIMEGFETFEDFLKERIYKKFGVGRSTAFEAMQICRFSGIPIEDYQKIGRTGFQVLNKAIPPGDEGRAWAKKLIDKAKELPVAELKALAVEKGYIESANEVEGAYVEIPCSKATLKKWETIISDPRVQSVCGSGKADTILKHMMEECSSWLAEGEGISQGEPPQPIEIQDETAAVA